MENAFVTFLINSWIWKFLQSLSLFHSHLCYLDTYRGPLTSPCMETLTLWRHYLEVFHSQWHSDGHKDITLMSAYASISARSKYIFVFKDTQYTKLLTEMWEKYSFFITYMVNRGKYRSAKTFIILETMKITWIPPYVATATSFIVTLLASQS
jgi:hypothetical protein